VRVTASGPMSSPATTVPFPPGTVLAGKYRVDRLLGEGGMGWVVVATHLQLEQRVALKFMRASQASASPEAVGRFLREARAAARIQSDHVARVSDVGTLEDGAPYLVMEYLEGQDLDSLLQTSPILAIDVAIEYAMQACEGLVEVHAAGIIHRDLKPANLFLARRSDGSVRVKLLDFGISKIAAIPGASPDGGMTSTQALMGSPLYMAPEQMRSSKNVDARADIWSMGVIVYEMLGGRSPFGGDTLPEVCARIMAEPPAPLRESRAEVPAALEAVVMRCLEKDPKRRFPDVATLAQALSAFGQSDARTTADRIGRVVRARQASSTDLKPDTTGSNAVGTGTALAIAQTAAAFGPEETSPTVRKSGGALPIYAAAVGLAMVGVVALVVMRGSPSEHPPTTSTATASPAATVTPVAPIASLLTIPEATPVPSPAPTVASGPAVAPAPVHPSSSRTTTATPVASTTESAPLVAPAHVRAKPKPSAPPAAAPAVADPPPAATSGFGGRD
jgi:serine/threonine protein kinase